MLRKKTFNKIISLALEALDAKAQQEPTSESAKFANDAYRKCIDTFRDALDSYIPCMTRKYYDPNDKTLPSLRTNAERQFKYILLWALEDASSEREDRTFQLISQLTAELNKTFQTNFTYNSTPASFDKLKEKLSAVCDSYLNEYRLMGQHQHSYIAKQTKELLEAISNVTNTKIKNPYVYRLCAFKTIFICLRNFFSGQTNSKRFLDKIKCFQEEYIDSENFPEFNGLCFSAFGLYISKFIFSKKPRTSAADAAIQLETLFEIFKFGNLDLFSEQSNSSKENTEDSSEEFSEQLRNTLAAI